MHEYLSEAVVLGKTPQGDVDSRCSLFTKKFGKLVAKAKSARKITSKLSSHLEPGNVAQVRVIEKGGLVVADALKIGRTGAGRDDVRFLDLMLAEGEPDQALWQMLVSPHFSWTKALKILGWDPAEASCGICAASPIVAFEARSQEFYCRTCASKAKENSLLFIN
ncbi:MAG TPA: recombination protein O N-terminal domain-containing protein [Candidatus Paceibacterota bacterium]|nr:recombination protein O N-terminal domain-containing protein [Candidatus Paceibacterota bacterium]